jgi:serine acetyltransferase
VTIAGGNVVIGDRTELGAGAKVLPNVKIGNHCHVGANAVVVEDMPDYSTCVMQKPRIILKNYE